MWQGITALYQLARKERLTVLIGWILGLMFASSLVFFTVEHGLNPGVRSYGEALYMTIISLTTVGYGDITPVTTIGRVSIVLVLMSFMVLMPLVAATITSIFVSQKIREESGLEKISFSNHILICGWNNNGQNILAGINELKLGGQVVLVGEHSQELFNDQADAYPELDLHFIKGPYTAEATLQRAGAAKAQVAIVLMNYSLDSLTRSDEHAVLAVLALRELGPKIRIVAECFASSYRGHLRRAGADRVIVSGELDSFMLTAAALSPGLDNTIKDALTFGSGQDMWTRSIPADFVGKSFTDLAVHWLQTSHWVLVGIVKANRRLSVTEVLGGDRSSIDEFIIRKFEEAGRGTERTADLHHLNPGPGYIIGAGDLAVVIYPAEQRNA